MAGQSFFFFFFLICHCGTSFLKQAKVPCLPAWCLQALPSDSFAFLPVLKDTQQRAVLLPRPWPDSLQIASQAVHLHLFSQNKLLSSDIKHHVSSFPLAVGKGKKMLRGHFSLWILAFHWKVPISTHFLCSSGKLCSAFQVTKQTEALTVLQAQVRKVGNFYFYRQGAHE